MIQYLLQQKQARIEQFSSRNGRQRAEVGRKREGCILSSNPCPGFGFVRINETKPCAGFVFVYTEKRSHELVLLFFKQIKRTARWLASRYFYFCSISSGLSDSIIQDSPFIPVSCFAVCGRLNLSSKSSCAFGQCLIHMLATTETPPIGITKRDDTCLQMIEHCPMACGKHPNFQVPSTFTCTWTWDCLLWRMAAQ